MTSLFYLLIMSILQKSENNNNNAGLLGVPFDVLERVRYRNKELEVQFRCDNTSVKRSGGSGVIILRAGNPYGGTFIGIVHNNRHFLFTQNKD